MKSLLMLTAAILPAVLLFLYIWKKDTQKEPTRWLVKAVMWGGVIIMPVMLVEVVINSVLFGEDGVPTNFAGSTAMAFLVAAIPEECFKLLALWLTLRKNPYFDEHFDGIVYAVCVGLGFAAVENISYVFSHEDWLSVAVTRSLLSVPGHYAFAVFMGYFYSVYHFVDRSPKNAVCILLVPVMIHGIYDALAMSGMANEYVGGVCFIVLIYFCFKMQKRALAKVLALVEKDKKTSIFVTLFLCFFTLSSFAQNVDEAIDLGLSVKWAIQNIGANSPTDFGTYLAWGEMEAKKRYWFDTYQYTDAEECEQCLIDLGESICGTEYDMARQLWKGKWRLPTNTEIMELINECSWEWTSIDGINGFRITGPNGNSIFLPAGGYISNDRNEELGVQCSYWGGTKSFIRNAHTLLAFVDEDNNRNWIRCWGDYRPLGRLVRPVLDKQ